MDYRAQMLVEIKYIFLQHQHGKAVASGAGHAQGKLICDKRRDLCIIPDPFQGDLALVPDAQRICKILIDQNSWAHACIKDKFQLILPVEGDGYYDEVIVQFERKSGMILSFRKIKAYLLTTDYTEGHP